MMQFDAGNGIEFGGSSCIVLNGQMNVKDGGAITRSAAWEMTVPSGVVSVYTLAVVSKIIVVGFSQPSRTMLYGITATSTRRCVRQPARHPVLEACLEILSNLELDPIRFLDLKRTSG